jgi:hypothetical protein
MTQRGTSNKAFNGSKKLKRRLLEEVTWHREHDHLAKGSYGTGVGDAWKGCAVGCSIASLNKLRGEEHDTADHAHFESVGVPRQLAFLVDYLFENLPMEDAQQWPERFWTAIRPGADLEMVHIRFIHWLLVDALGPNKQERIEECTLLNACAALYGRWLGGDKPTNQEFLDLAARAALADCATSADFAARVALAALDDLAALTARADLDYLDARADYADFAALAARSYLDYLAALAARADLAALAARADLDYLDARADRAARVKSQADKLVELLEAA